ncbi:MAG: hypothetical protein KIG42_03415 [Paludibacteraceae bacterium]|nr:hypothetical protein [Paludibacteraceae bacterium]
MYICAGLLLIACTSKKQSFSENDIQGKYDIDFSTYLSELNMESEEDSLGIAFAAILLSQMEMTMQFDGDKLIIDGAPIMKNLVNVFGDTDVQMPMSVAYEIRNDSVLYIKYEENDFEKYGILRKIDDSYDNLQLVVEEDGEKTFLTLRRQEK